MPRKELYEDINLYLKTEGLSPNPRLIKELMRAWSGFTLTGDELKRAPRLVNPKSYAVLRSSEPSSRYKILALEVTVLSVKGVRVVLGFKA